MLSARLSRLLLLPVLACTRAPSPSTAPSAGDRLVAPAGRSGDTLWVLLTPVRAEQRDSFDRLMERLWRMGQDFGARRDSVVLRTFRRTRMLRPLEPNPDGTWTYVLVTDPRISGAEYGLQPLLRRMLPADSAEGFLKAFEATLAGDQQRVLTVQIQPHR